MNAQNATTYALCTVGQKDIELTVICVLILITQQE